MLRLWGSVVMYIPVTQQGPGHANFLSSAGVFHSVFFFFPSVIILYTLAFFSLQSTLPCSSWIL